MPSLREMWNGFPARIEREVRRRGYSDFVFTLEGNSSSYPVNIIDRTPTGWATVEYPMGPFIGNGLMGGSQTNYRRYRYGTGGRVVVDNAPPADARAFARLLRFANRATSARSIIERLGLGDWVPEGYSVGLPRISFNGATVGWAGPGLINLATVNRCCHCREVNTHTCCNGGSYGWSYSNCSICDLPRGAARGRCVCNSETGPNSGTCAHNWAAVRVDSYSSPAPNGFRSISTETGDPLWSSRPSADIPFYLGVEWEVSGDADSIGAAILNTMEGSPWVNSNGALPLIVKSDSTVEGEEICFSPMSPGAALAFPWDTLADNLDRNYDEPAGHGVHVHISGSAFPDDNSLRRWIDLLSIDLRPMAERVARRTGSSWAYFNTARTVDGRNSLAQNGRYSAVNANTHHGTHEVRIFRSADTGDQMRAAVAFVAATVDYVRNTPGGEVLTPRGFLDFVSGSMYADHLSEWVPAGFPLDESDSETATVSAGGVTADPWVAAAGDEVVASSFRAASTQPF